MSNDISYKLYKSEHGEGQVLAPTGQWKEECSTRLKVGDIRSVRLIYSAGFHSNDIGFLADFPDLEEVELYSASVKDLIPLKQLRRIEVLGLQTTSKTEFNPGVFPLLRVALFQWRAGLKGLFEAENLEYLNVSNFPFAELTSLHRFALLRRLALTSRKLETISGISALKNLEELDFYACPNFLSLQASVACRKPVRIEVESCRHILSGRKEAGSLEQFGLT